MLRYSTLTVPSLCMLQMIQCLYREPLCLVSSQMQQDCTIQGAIGRQKRHLATVQGSSYRETEGMHVKNLVLMKRGVNWVKL